MAVESYTHVVSEVVTYVERQFGDEAQIQVDSADIIRWINAGQREIITNNSSVNEAVAIADITNGRGNYPLDADSAFKGIQNITSVLVQGVPLKGMTFQEALTYLQKESPVRTGKPTIWYQKVGLLNLWPVPTEDITQGLQIYFTKAAADVTAVGDKIGIPDNFYNALVQYVMQQVYEMDENFQAAAAKAQQFDKSVNLQQNRSDVQDAYFPNIQGDPEDWY